MCYGGTENNGSRMFLQLGCCLPGGTFCRNAHVTCPSSALLLTVCIEHSGTLSLPRALPLFHCANSRAVLFMLPQMGVMGHEAAFLRLVDKLTNGTEVHTCMHCIRPFKTLDVGTPNFSCGFTRTNHIERVTK